MVHIYPRNRKEIITINGIFDPCQDTTEMSELWTLAGLGWWASGSYGLNWSQVVSPGAIGGYSHKFDGVIHGGIGMWGMQGISPFKNKGYQYNISPINSFYWKMRAEFRLRIEDDATNGASGNLSHCLGFNLDGNVMHYGLAVTAGSGNTSSRTSVNFHVTDQLIAVVSANGSTIAAEIKSSVAWTGAFNTWYDVRIEWSHNWYASPNVVSIEVFVNNVSVLTYDLDYPEEWRNTDEADLSTHSFMGRCGPGIYLEMDGGSPALSTVVGYYKDILITQEFRPVQWEAVDSIVQSGEVSNATLEITSNFKWQFGEGSDLRIFKRNRLTDDWASRFRGTIREVEPKERRNVLIEAEGYESVLFDEKTNNKSYTTQTAGYIVADSINDPDKGEFDVSTYFDTTVTTYSREYMHTKKMTIMTEMASLEGYLLFLDWRNNWHFESYRTNQLPIHLIWGESRITDIDISYVFVRRPNKIRVIGKGFTAEREIAVDTYSSGSIVLRNFNRLDLTTQAEVDEALDLYISEVRTSIRVAKIQMRANHSLKKGHIIRVTSPIHGLQNQQFSIASIKCTKTNRMTLSLLEVKPHTPALLSDLSKRVDIKESDSYPSEYIAANDFYNIEGEATVLVNGTYEIEYDSSVVQTEKVIITDELMDDLVELWNAESPTQPTYLAYGTGSTEPLFSDTVLDTETSRSAVSVARAVNIGNTTSPVYRTIEYSIIVASPSSITELGLFNAASNGDMACRAVFDSYSQAGSVTFRIKLTIIPKPGFAYLSIKGLEKITDWLYDGSTVTPTHISNMGYRSFAAPTPYTLYIPSTAHNAWAWWIPDLATPGTFTKTKLYDRNMIKFVFEYPDYDEADYGGSKAGDGSQQERLLALMWSTATDRDQFLVCIFHRTQNDYAFYQGFDCKWIIWLKFIAGEVEY